MNTLILFNESIVLPINVRETAETYGLVIDHDKWMRYPYRRDYIYYIFVTAELLKDGITSSNGIDFEKDGESCHPYLEEYKRRVLKSNIKYAITEEAVGLDEDDYFEILFTNKEKWAELIGKGGLVWA